MPGRQWCVWGLVLVVISRSKLLFYIFLHRQIDQSSKDSSIRRVQSVGIVHITHGVWPLLSIRGEG